MALLDRNNRGGRQFSSLLVALFLVLLPLAYFYPAVKGDLVLMIGDGWIYSMPMRLLLGQMLAGGGLPLWNPYTFAGMPLLAAIQPGALYPPNWLFAVFSPGTAMNIVVITTYHVVLIGCYFYARSLGFVRIAALVTAVIFSFGGFMISHLEDTNFIAPVAWLPWILFALEKLYLRATWGMVVAGAVFIALQCFAGLPQATWLMLLICVPYGLFSLLLREEKERRRRFASAVALMAVCGLLLSAIQMLPTFELQHQGGRAQIGYDEFSTFSLQPRRLLTLIFPFFFGGGLPPLYRVAGWDEWWTLKWTYGYVGLSGLLLGSIAVIGFWRQKMVKFWTVVAALSLILSFGSYLPFGLNHLLYRVPIYNLFRGSYRHSLEFTFALAVLAGFGANYIGQCEWPRLRKIVFSGISLLTVLVVMTALIYRFVGSKLGASIAQPAKAGLLTNPEAFVPLVCFVLSSVAVWIYARRQTAITRTTVLVVLLIDLASFGQYTQWRTMGFSVMESLADSPAIAHIKSIEPDLYSFRVLNYSPWPFGANYQDLNHANLAVARGIQNVTGYDPMRLSRTAAIAGDIDIFGVVRRASAFDVADQGFNLLNVKYLLLERTDHSPDRPSVKHEGINFGAEPLNIILAPGKSVELDARGSSAIELAIVSTMTNSTHIPEGATVARIKMHTTDGHIVERELQTGRDTSEWAFDRPDVRSTIKHKRAHIVESWETEGFHGHHYLARSSFPRIEIESVELEYARPDANLSIVRAALYDPAKGESTSLEHRFLPFERWRKLKRWGEVEIYENLKLLPRAWFARRIRIEKNSDVLQIIKTGKMKDGSAFDPAETVLFEREDFGNREFSLPEINDNTGADVRITSYEPGRIELQTRNQHAGFLVLSEIYYRGWEALIDGKRTPVERANYALRGVAVPSGDHRIEFIFRAHSFRTGAIYSAIGSLVLIVGGIVSANRRKRSVRL